MDRRIALLRVLACFMVVQLHVAAELFRRYGTPGWWAGNVYDSLVRACVPLFFMIAGATLLRRDEPLGVFFTKRASRIVLPLVFWSLFYLWWLWYNGGGPANWLLAVLSGPTMFHLWYFYALVGLYALVPVLRKFYLHGSRREHLWFLLMWLLVASLLPTGQALLFKPHCEGMIRFDHLGDVYHLAYFGGYVGFLVLGAYLADGRPSQVAGLAVFVAASAATILGTYWLSAKYGSGCEFFFVYLSPFVIAAAWGLFSAILALPEGPTPKWLGAVADCTLGVYGLHVFMIDPVFMRQGWTALAGSPWISPVLVALGVFVACLIPVYLLRQVKPLRRII